MGRVDVAIDAATRALGYARARGRSGARGRALGRSRRAPTASRGSTHRATPSASEDAFVVRDAATASGMDVDGDARAGDDDGARGWGVGCGARGTTTEASERDAGEGSRGGREGGGGGSAERVAVRALAAATRRARVLEVAMEAFETAAAEALEDAARAGEAALDAAIEEFVREREEMEMTIIALEREMEERRARAVREMDAVRDECEAKRAKDAKQTKKLKAAAAIAEEIMRVKDSIAKDCTRLREEKRALEKENKKLWRRVEELERDA